MYFFSTYAFTLDDNSLSLDQDINRFLIMVGIEPQISITSVLENKILAILPIKWLKMLPSLWLYIYNQS